MATRPAIPVWQTPAADVPRRKRAHKRDLGRAGYAAYLRAAAEEDPANPEGWGLYCRYVQGITRPRRPRTPPKGGVKPPLVDPLVLANSALTPDRLWAGPDPVWESDPEWSGDPEYGESRGSGGESREYPPRGGESDPEKCE